MKKVFSVFLCILLAVCLFSSCKKTEITALYFAVSGSAGSFDPQIAGDGAVNIVVRNCFEGLIYIDENGSAQPGAAERWEISPDGKTYTFYLRSGSLWHLTNTVKNELGDKLPKDFAPEVTAYDFEFALKRACDPQTGAKNAWLLSNIQGFAEIAALGADINNLAVTAADKYTLKITLCEPEEGFLEALAEPICMPCNEVFFEAAGGRYGLLIKYMMSNGPFYLTRFDDNSFRMAKNPDYSGGHTAKTDVVWLYSDVASDKLKENLSDNTYSGALLSEYACEELNIKKSYTLSVPDILRGLIFNFNNPELANQNVRASLIAATDINEQVSSLGKERAASLYPACVKYASAYKNAYNEKNAADLLQTGLEELEQTELNFTLLCEERFDNAVRRLNQEWQRIFGIRLSVNIETVSATELESRVKSGNYDIALYPVAAPFFAPYAYFSQFSVSDKNSIAFAENEEFDNAVNELRFALTGSYSSLVAKAERLLADGAFLLPFWQESSCLLCTGAVSGVHFLGGNRLYFYDALSQ